MKKILSFVALAAMCPAASMAANPEHQTVSASVVTAASSPVSPVMSQPHPLQTTSVPPDAPPADEAKQLALLEKRIPVLKAQAEIARQEAEIAKAEAEKRNAALPPATPGTQALSLSASLPPSATVQAPTSSRPATPAKTPDWPDITGIKAFNGKFRASLDVNGNDVPVREGDQIDGGWSIGPITETTVLLVKGKQTHLLRW